MARPPSWLDGELPSFDELPPNIRNHEHRIRALEGGIRLVYGLVVIVGVLTFLAGAALWLGTIGHHHG